MLLETTRGTQGKEDEITVPYTFQLIAEALGQNQVGSLNVSLEKLLEKVSLELEK